MDEPNSGASPARTQPGNSCASFDITVMQTRTVFYAVFNWVSDYPQRERLMAFFRRLRPILCVPFWCQVVLRDEDVREVLSHRRSQYRADRFERIVQVTKLLLERLSEEYFIETALKFCQKMPARVCVCTLCTASSLPGTPAQPPIGVRSHWLGGRPPSACDSVIFKNMQRCDVMTLQRHNKNKYISVGGPTEVESTVKTASVTRAKFLPVMPSLLSSNLARHAREIVCNDE